MTEPRHRKTKRRKGMTLGGSTGKRRASGVLIDELPSREELAGLARRRATWQARRRIVLAVLVAVVLVGGAVLLSTWLRSRTPSDPTGEAPVASLPDTGASLLAIVLDDEGEAASIALVGAAAEGPNRVVLFYPSLLVTLPGFGENLYSRAPRFGGAELMDTATANLAGVRIDSVVMWTEQELAAAIGQELTVDLPTALLVQDESAEVVVAAQGVAQRTPEEVALFMVERGTSDELDHLQRQGGVWRAILAAAAEDAGLVGRLTAAASTPEAAHAALAGAATGEAVVTLVNATRIEPTGGEERYQLDGAEAATFVEANVPYLQLAEEPRIRIEVLNGNGRIGTTRPVAARLVEEGFRVVITDNADRSDYLETRIIAHGRENQEGAVAVHDVLGRGEVSIETRQPSGVVDVTIIVGEDLPAGEG